VLAELASVLTRKPHIVKNIAKRLGLRKEEAVFTILIYVLNRFSIKYRSVNGAVRLPILGNVCVPVALAIELSSRARLKTLDLLHLAYAKAMKEGGDPIDMILTADAGFEKAKELLKEIGIELRIIQ